MTNTRSRDAIAECNVLLATQMEMECWNSVDANTSPLYNRLCIVVNPIFKFQARYGTSCHSSKRCDGNMAGAIAKDGPTEEGLSVPLRPWMRFIQVYYVVNAAVSATALAVRFLNSTCSSGMKSLRLQSGLYHHSVQPTARKYTSGMYHDSSE